MVLGVHTVADGSANSAFDAITTEFSKVKEVGAELQVPTANITLKNVVASTSDGASTQTKLTNFFEKHTQFQVLLKTSVQCIWESIYVLPRLLVPSSAVVKLLNLGLKKGENTVILIAVFIQLPS